MSAATVVVVITRPRPPQAHAGDRDPDKVTVNVLYDPNDSDAEILRKAADQLDAGLQIPGSG